MTIETGIKAKLTAAATTAAGRIYPKVLPHDCTLPAVTFQRITTERVRSHTGPSGLAFARFQINAWAATHLAVTTLANEIRAALDNGLGTWDDADVQMCDLEDEGDLEAVVLDDPSQIRHGIRQDYEIHHAES